MTSLTLTLSFGPIYQGSCVVSANSSWGEETGVFNLPLSPEELQQMNLDRRGSESPLFLPTSFDPVKDGLELFGALFNDRILILYRNLAVLSQEGLLVVKLKFNPRSQGFGILHSLPWEYLYDPDEQQHLARMREINLVRELVIPRKAAPAARMKFPLKALFVWADPHEGTPGALKPSPEEHLSGLESEIDGKRGIQFTRCDQATREKLMSQLEQFPKGPDIIYFYLHGHFDKQRGGLVVLPDEQGGETLFPADELAALINQFHPEPKRLRMVFLNACSSAVADEPKALAGIYYSGLAPSLALQGVHHVVAMTHEILAERATRFATIFFKALAGGASPGQGMSRARSLLRVQYSEDIEWGKPVLYSQSPLGPILKFEWSTFQRVWTFVAVVLFYLCLSTVDKTQQWQLGLPGVQRVSHSAALYGLLFVPLLYAFLLLMSIYFARNHCHRCWHERVPRFWDLSLNMNHPFSRVFQGFLALLFLFWPAYATGHFFDKFLAGTIHGLKKEGCGIKALPSPEVRNYLTVVAPEQFASWKKKRDECLIEVSKGYKEHFSLSNLREKQKQMIKGKNKFYYGDAMMEYFPIWETWLLALVVFVDLVLFIFLMVYLFRPFGKKVRHSGSETPG